MHHCVNFTKLTLVHLGTKVSWWDFEVKRSKVKVTDGQMSNLGGILSLISAIHGNISKKLISYSHPCPRDTNNIFKVIVSKVKSGNNGIEILWARQSLKRFEPQPAYTNTSCSGHKLTRSVVFKLFWPRTPFSSGTVGGPPALVTVKFTTSTKYPNSCAHRFLQTYQHHQLYIQITMDGKQC